MHQILIVDDEPLICKGLSALLHASGLGIGQIFTAGHAYEALDTIRMEDIDLLITDIQMGEMSGIDLMQQAKIIKPWLPSIIISAHETFQYAQMALRLGAKDYLIKPLKNEQFLRSVRSALLGLNKPVLSEEEVLSSMREHFRMVAPRPEKADWLNRLLEQGPGTDGDWEEAISIHGLELTGPYYAVIRLRLQDDQTADRDIELLQYAALNIVDELLGQQWTHTAFYSPGREISIILEWSEGDYAAAPSIPKLHQLDTIGRSLHVHICKYLRRPCIVGISQILRGREFLPVLSRQAHRAMEWHGEYEDHFVFYYGDFKWSLDTEEASQEEWSAHNSMIVGKAKEYIDGHYAQKGLTLQEVAHKNHVSPNYLSYLFKKHMGCNLWDYVIQLRMEESRRLLLHTDLRRYEIAERVGYESPEHFSKMFKRFYGISPSELKKGT